jgi:hypothetical protein
MKRACRILLIVVLAGGVLLVGSPYIVYWAALATLPGYPEAPEPLASIGTAELEIWAEYSGHSAFELKPVSPVQYVWLLMACENVDACLDAYPGLLVAGRVAQGYLRQQEPTRAIWWHVRSASLGVWLTRHWSAEQLLAQIVKEHRAL